eukprot:scaffold237920_cov21-Tisochrysis_lutea.AAC.1
MQALTQFVRSSAMSVRRNHKGVARAVWNTTRGSCQSSESKSSNQQHTCGPEYWARCDLAGS